MYDRGKRLDFCICGPILLLAFSYSPRFPSTLGHRLVLDCQGSNQIQTLVRCCFTADPASTAFTEAPKKNDTLEQCWGNVGPSSTTPAQHWPNIVSMCRVCWQASRLMEMVRIAGCHLVPGSPLFTVTWVTYWLLDPELSRTAVTKATDPDVRHMIGRDGHLDQSRAYNLGRSLWGPSLHTLNYYLQ